MSEVPQITILEVNKFEEVLKKYIKLIGIKEIHINPLTCELIEVVY